MVQKFFLLKLYFSLHTPWLPQWVPAKVSDTSHWFFMLIICGNFCYIFHQNGYGQSCSTGSWSGRIWFLLIFIQKWIITLKGHVQARCEIREGAPYLVKTFFHIVAYLNLALGKPAWQVVDLSADNTADKAVDGNARNAPTNLCAHGDAANVRIYFFFKKRTEFFTKQ